MNFKNNIINSLANEIYSYGAVNHDFGNNVGGLEHQQNPFEFAKLLLQLNILFPQGIPRYLEIGSAAGGTLYLINKYVGIQDLSCVDIEKNGKRTNILIEMDIPTLEIIKDSTSTDCKNFLSAQPKFDLIFIDGNHSYNIVVEDTKTAIDNVKIGGYILYHDHIFVADVRRALNDTIEKDERFSLVFVCENIWNEVQSFGLKLFKRIQ